MSDHSQEGEGMGRKGNWEAEEGREIVVRRKDGKLKILRKGKEGKLGVWRKEGKLKVRRKGKEGKLSILTHAVEIWYLSVVRFTHVQVTPQFLIYPYTLLTANWACCKQR